MSVVTRFAPSPTGHLHIGSARTALFSWLYARHVGGTFLLRIEDTDLERSKQDFVQTIIEDLRWLELAVDKPAVFQSQRLELYQKSITDLKQKAAVYEKEGALYIKTELGREALRKRGQLTSKGAVDVIDALHGTVSFPADELVDFVIVRSDGMPVFHLAVVIDDADMGVTHVIRGDDHLSNVPKQMLLQALLDLPTPVYAHLPLILGPDRTRLSKRHGATKLDEFKQQGILPAAMINYLSRLGWGFGDQEIFSLGELVEKFDLDRVNKTAAVFDYQKLQWLNKHYLQQLTSAELLAHLEAMNGRTLQHLAPAIALLALKSAETKDILDNLIYFESDEYPTDPSAATKHLSAPETRERMQHLLDRLSGLENFEPTAIETALRSLAEQLKIKAGDLIHPLRVILTGRGVSPGIFELSSVLGRTQSLNRLARWLKTTEKH